MIEAIGFADWKGGNAMRTRAFILKEVSEGAKTYWQLLARGRVHPSLLIAELERLAAEGAIAYTAQSFSLTDRGRTLGRALGVEPGWGAVCPTCDGRGLAIPDSFAEVARHFDKIASYRPPATGQYDQGFIPPEHTLLRVAILSDRGDLAGRELFLLGDDDLTSVAAALTGMPRRIHVLEIDARLVAFLQEVARDYGWKDFSVERYDAQDPLPELLRGGFDTFFTDPVETLAGFSLFVSRGVSSLKGEGAAGYFGLTRLEASVRKWQEVQRRLLAMNLVITDLLDGFHEYEVRLSPEHRVLTECPFDLRPPDLNWYRSSLYRVELVGDPRPFYEGAVTLGRGLYYDDEAYVTLP